MPDLVHAASATTPPPPPPCLIQWSQNSNQTSVREAIWTDQYNPPSNDQLQELLCYEQSKLLIVSTLVFPWLVTHLQLYMRDRSIGSRAWPAFLLSLSRNSTSALATLEDELWGQKHNLQERWQTVSRQEIQKSEYRTMRHRRYQKNFKIEKLLTEIFFLSKST